MPAWRRPVSRAGSRWPEAADCWRPRSSFSTPACCGRTTLPPWPIWGCCCRSSTSTTPRSPAPAEPPNCGPTMPRPPWRWRRCCIGKAASSRRSHRIDGPWHSRRAIRPPGPRSETAWWRLACLTRQWPVFARRCASIRINSPRAAAWRPAAGRGRRRRTSTACPCCSIARICRSTIASPPGSPWGRCSTPRAVTTTHSRFSRTPMPWCWRRKRKRDIASTRPPSTQRSIGRSPR